MGKTPATSFTDTPDVHIRLSVLGGFALYDQLGNRIEVPSKKVRAIIAYVLLEGGRPVSRERLAGLLWSDRSEQNARQSLRQSLVKMRSIFEKANFSSFKIGREDIHIHAECVSVDIFAFEEALLDRRVLADTINESSQPDRILSGLESLDELFGSWIQHIRHHWRERLSNSLGKLLEDSDQETARVSANALLQIDPTHEPAHRRLIRYNADIGNDPAAERQYKLLWDQLAEYDAEPDCQSQHLITQVKLGTYRDDAASAIQVSPSVQEQDGTSAGVPQLPFIYVQEFKSVVPNEGGSAIATGLRLEFISNLVRFRDWTVLDASTEHTNPGYIDAGSGLNGSAFLVEGTIHEPAGEQVIVVTLKDLRSGAYLWSDSKAVNAENWSQVQRRITIQIAASLDKQLTAKFAANNIAVHQIENEAYCRWLDSHHKIWSFNPAVRAQAETTLRGIVKDYPNFAPAYTGLVLVIDTNHMQFPGVMPDMGRLREGAVLANKAVTLDPLDARNIVNLAWSSAMIGQFDQAEANFRQARDLNPNNPMSAISSANGLSMCGDLETGYRWSKESIDQLPRITPVQWGFLASTFCICGKYEECIQAAETSKDVIPVVPGYLTIAKAMIGEAKDAKRAADQFYELCRSNWQGPTRPSRNDVAMWFLAHCPLSDNRLRAPLEAGLRMVKLMS